MFRISVPTILLALLFTPCLADAQRFGFQQKSFQVASEGAGATTTHVVVFGPEEYVRERGERPRYRDAFPARSGTGTMKIVNGDLGLEDAVHHAAIYLNGERILGPRDFGRGGLCRGKDPDDDDEDDDERDDERPDLPPPCDRFVELPVDLLEQNSLRIRIRGIVGSRISVTVTQEIEGEAAEVIGPEGGTVEAPPGSPLAGTALVIAPGALGAAQVVSLEVGEVPSAYPGEIAGPVIRLEPSGLQLDPPATLFYPYDDVDDDGVIDGTDIAEEDLQLLLWTASDPDVAELVSLGGADPESNRLSATVPHFSELWGSVVRFPTPGTIRWALADGFDFQGVPNETVIPELREAIRQWSEATDCLLDYEVDPVPASELEPGSEHDILFEVAEIPYGRSQTLLDLTYGRRIVRFDPDADLQFGGGIPHDESFSFAALHIVGHAFGVRHFNPVAEEIEALAVALGYAGDPRGVAIGCNWVNYGRYVFPPLEDVESIAPSCFSFPAMAAFPSGIETEPVLAMEDVDEIYRKYNVIDCDQPDAVPLTFFGRDLRGFFGPRPRSEAAKLEFVNNLETAGVQGFESVPTGSIGMGLTIGFEGATAMAEIEDLAPHDGVTEVVEETATETSPSIAISGVRHLRSSPVTDDTPGSPGDMLSIEFDAPQPAVGLWVTGVGATLFPGPPVPLGCLSSDLTLVATVEGPAGSREIELTEGYVPCWTTFFLGLINTENPIERVTFSGATGYEAFGLDDIYVGTPTTDAAEDPCPCFTEERLIVEAGRYDDVFSQLADRDWLYCDDPANIGIAFCIDTPFPAQCLRDIDERNWNPHAGVYVMDNTCNFRPVDLREEDPDQEGTTVSDLEPEQFDACYSHLQVMRQLLECP